MLSNQSGNGDGTQDDTGYDGILGYTIRPIDSREQTLKNFQWDFRDVEYELSWNFNYNTYTQMRNLPHDIDWTGANDLGDVVSQYASFGDPNENLYLRSFAETVKSYAIADGYTSELEVAEFVYAFVGDIQYQQNEMEVAGDSDYPKFPIETLWDQNGDCEDVALLYVAMMELLGYDAVFAVGEVKSDQDDEWGGHAWALIHISGHDGDGWEILKEGSAMPFYWVEATSHYDGVSEIGYDPWFDVNLLGIWDSEYTPNQ